MKTSLLALGLLGLLALFGFSSTTQVLVPDMNNIVAQRLPGGWMIDAESSRALDPDRYSAAITAIEFRQDASVLERLRAANPRFRTRQVSQAGWVTINREAPVPFVISIESGNPTLTWFTPLEGEGALGTANSVAICVVCSRGGRGDWLALGGDAGGLPAAMYHRTK